MSETLLIGGGGTGGDQSLVLKRANRHGLIAGATGTGKTVTLQVLAEGFSRAGVPVFLADVKGDVAGMAMPGSATARTHEPFTNRARDLGIADYAYEAFPVIFWDLFGEQGHPVRTTMSEMGPLLLARLMGLSDAQEGILNIAFRYADDEGLLLIDMKDLRQLLSHIGDNRAELSTRYGNITTQSVGAIQRQLLTLEAQGGDRFFGEPALDIADFMRVSDDGRGIINILAADRLMASPRLYSTFLLWLLSELFEALPEVGDPEKPRLVFFFDEAHLLFDGAPRALIEKVEQVVRLIRSKGVGVYFVTQNPIDVPETVAGQLGNRVQHALRAFTPRDQRAVRSAAETFRPNPKVDVVREITELKVGEALVSLLMADGAPSPVERTLIQPPRSRAGPISETERRVMLASSPVAGRYEAMVDRESAYEILSARASEAAEAKAAEAQAKADARAETEAARAERARQVALRNSPQGQMAEVAKKVVMGVAIVEGRRLLRGFLGGLTRSMSKGHPIAGSASASARKTPGTPGTRTK